MTLKARKILLPKLTLTEVVAEEDATTSTISTQQGEYHVRPKQVARNGGRRDGKAEWNPHQYNFFPVILDCAGVPWAEANLFLLSKLEGAVAPVMSTYSSIAGDLAAYRQFLDETGVDWMHFPAHKLTRPTYRYNGHLKFAVGADELSAATAKRRMGTVISFYRWLKNESVLTLEHPAWKESDRYVEFKDSHGFSQTKKIVTTDVSIRTPKQHDPYDGMIDDGGKLRPLPQSEQEWLLEALLASGNTEMTLIHLFAILTGARIQTILTFRVRHVLVETEDVDQSDLRFPVGPGTGIDTKHDKKMVLHIPVWFYRMLRTYAHSERAIKRRERAVGGDTENQYLFLSIRGAPMYESKESSRAFDGDNLLRHQKTGQGVRQFITEKALPYIRSKYAKDFHYQFHDLRATYGMNLTDYQLEMIEKGEATLSQVREFVKTRMGHQSAATTDLYLQYRHNFKLARHTNTQYESHLRSLMENAMNGISDAI